MHHTIISSISLCFKTSSLKLHNQEVPIDLIPWRMPGKIWLVLIANQLFLRPEESESEFTEVEELYRPMRSELLRAEEESDSWREMNRERDGKKEREGE